MTIILIDQPNPLYYLDNFRRVLDWITQRYSDLLVSEEQDFIERFSRLPQVSQALLVRMVMRKGSLFRSSKLRYDEIGCSDAAVQPLIAQGWVVPNPVISIEELFGLLKKAEVLDTFNFKTHAKSARKADLLEHVRDTFSESRAFSAWSTRLDDKVYQVCITNWCERLRLMFFGNLHQNWSEFVLSDLGIYRYEQVELTDTARGFLSRQDVDDYLHLHNCRECFDQGETLDDILSKIPNTPSANPWIESRRNKLLFKLAYQYERCGETDIALTIYRQCRYPGARLRQIRVLERCHEIDAAYTLAQLASQIPESEAEHQSLQRILPRLLKKRGLVKHLSVKRAAIEQFNLVLPYPAQPTSVEHLVCKHYSCEHAPTLYVENTLINSLFGLLCWPAIFAPLPGAFFHPFHHGPANLHSPDFYSRRAVLFDACLAQLDSDAYRDAILQTFHTKHGIQSPFVFWHAIDEALLTLALSCLPAAHLRKWFERILLDIPSNRSGFPDLIQFWPQENRYRMLEVKGPGDRLQDNQIRWLEYCVAHAMPVAVCYVQWEEAA